MKKQILTIQEIQREILKKLNKRKNVAAWLTVLVSVFTVFYIMYVIDHAKEVGFEIGMLEATATIIIVPIVILLFIVFLLRYYYISLYHIQTGKIEVIEEALCQKEKELVSYYRGRTEKENALYFRCGRIAVEEQVYHYSNIGDRFCIVILGSKKTPHLVYHMKYYEMKM